MRRFLVAVLITGALAVAAAARQAPAVRVWAGSVQIPTYAEGPANPNPPFDRFTVGRFNYPYPIRDALTDRRELVSWRTLHLENEYLRLTVLPDLGGHIYSCTDKRTGREMFYANSAIKKALIGYRGAWAALGVEFNFPVSHNWMSMSPVDFATRENGDGSASIWVGNTDQVYGMRWRVELRLQPARAVLEQNVELYNASDVRHRYYWWSNAAVQAWEDSRLVYPTQVMATHGFTSVEPWPVDRRGRDLSVIRNQTDGPVSLFTHLTREPFVGVYHPRTGSGTVHVADPGQLPVHKVWSWGNDRDAAFWRTALSDDDSAYVELQAGLFRNQETYAFLEPQESVRFTEHWLPVRDLGGITRANVDGVLHMERPTPTTLQVALDAARDVPDARLRLLVPDTGREIFETRAAVSPKSVWRLPPVPVPTAPVTFELLDRTGSVVLRHTENTFDSVPASQAKLGPQRNDRSPRQAARSAEDFAKAGELDELEGRRLVAMDTYRAGLAKFPDDFTLLKAAGRLAVGLGWPYAGWDAVLDSDANGNGSRASAGRQAAGQAADWLQRAHALDGTDSEVSYYLGSALVRNDASGDPATDHHWKIAARFRATRVASLLQLARFSARRSDTNAALAYARAGIAEAPRATALGRMEVLALRRLNRRAEAAERARHWSTVDPTDSVFRYELTRLGEDDPQLWIHLAADANRLLDIADHYIAAGDQEARQLLEREFPAVAPPMREPGAVAPAESPLVAYYRARQRNSGRDATAATELARARTLRVDYVFPARPLAYLVLTQAVRSSSGEDPNARFLLGAQYLASGLDDAAIEAWQRVRPVRPAIPTLHRNLGLALIHGAGDIKEARAVLEEGVGADPENVEIYSVLDGVLSAANAPASRRVGMLRRFPSADRMPSLMVFKLALALAEAGDAAGAERLFHDRFFPREEGGTNVRAVYAQVRVTSARVAAQAGKCADARDIVNGLPAERSDLAFTRGGMADAVASPMMDYQLAAIESSCGDRAAAQNRWNRLARPLTSGGSPLALALADRARARLGKARTLGQRRRLEDALESATRTLQSGGTSSPGTMELARAMLLNALERAADSQAAFQRAFIHPDRNLSHAHARLARSERIGSPARKPAKAEIQFDVEKRE